MEKRMNHSAQVTVFIILAIVLVAAGGIAYYMVKNSGGDKYFSQPDVKPGVDNIKNSIYECQIKIVSDSLEIIGIQGGYYKAPQEYLNLGYAFIPYYYKQGSFLMPSNAEIQNQLGMYVDENLNNCLDIINVSDFSLTYTKSRTNAVISKEDVKFTINMPVSIKRADKTIQLQLKDNPIVQNSKLYDMIEIARYITDSHKTNPDSICINCIANLAEEKNLYVASLSLNDSLLYIISDNSTAQGKNYYFEFLNKYDGAVI